MKCKLYFVTLLTVIPSLANALGLGNLNVNSALNEPFDAKIELLSPTADELDSLKVELADSEAFARAKIERPFLLSKLRFQLHRSDNNEPDYIRVYSRESIREPFLNFLVELNWSKGRLFRQYTVLLDPPLYDPSVRTTEKKSVKKISPSVSSPTIDSEHKVVYAHDFDDYGNNVDVPASSPRVNYASDDYGPTVSLDTLWSIAKRMRPDTSISINQMMLALFRANPEAFFKKNINALKVGQVLQMPSDGEINALSKVQALEEAKIQYAAWEEITANVADRSETNGMTEAVIEEIAEETHSTSVLEARSEDKGAELKLVATNNNGESSQKLTGTDSGSGESMILAQESLQVLTQENIELNDRLRESDIIINDLKRLLQLKDDELASLQQQFSAQAETPVIEGDVAEDDTEKSATEESIVEEDVVEQDISKDDQDITKTTDVITEETEEAPTATSSGVMGIINGIIASIKTIFDGNPLYIIAVVVIVVVLILGTVLMYFRNRTEETTVHIDTDITAVSPESDFEDINVSPQSELETVTVEEVADTTFVQNEEDGSTEQVSGEKESAASIDGTDNDLFQEVNTYIVFERFDQAEELVRNAINDDPNKPAFHAKLLEVFYGSGNKEAYEKEAKVLYELVGGSGEHWDVATAMWSEMSPNQALFADSTDDNQADGSTNDTVNVEASRDQGSLNEGITTNINNEFVDITTDDEVADDSGIDFDIGLDDERTSAALVDGDISDITPVPHEDDHPLDKTVVTGFEPETDENLLDVDVSAESNDDTDSPESPVDFDIGIDSEKDKLPDEAQDEVIEFELDDNTVKEIVPDNVIEFDMAVGNGAEADPKQDADLEIDLSEMDIDKTATGSDIEKETDKKTLSDDSFSPELVLEESEEKATDFSESDMDLEGTVELSTPTINDIDEDIHTEVATKLDLAKAYVELGDKDNAKTILDEVMIDGNNEQQKQAKELLDQLQ